MSKNNPEETKGANGWSVNKKLVLHRQEEVEHDLRNIRKRVENLERQVAIQASQTRMVAGAIGAICGLVPALLSILLTRM